VSWLKLLSAVIRRERDWENQEVGVVGCGVMSSGIAQVCAQSGYHVVVSEIDNALLNKSMASIRSRLSIDVGKPNLSPTDKDRPLSHIQGTTNINDFSDCDLIVEAIIEN
jgi:3-hydroxybutyryl-CoA dehydrogenase